MEPQVWGEGGWWGQLVTDELWLVGPLCPHPLSHALAGPWVSLLQQG